MDGAHQTYDDIILTQGRSLRIRALETTDRAGLLALFERLSPESRRRRFLAPKPALNARELAYLTNVDHVDHEALVAVDPGNDSIVAVARYARIRDERRVADVAMAVADDVQRMGIGLRLGRLLVARARTNRFDVLLADTLCENYAALALVRRLGFRARTRHGYQIEFELRLTPQRKESGRTGVFQSKSKVI